MENMQTDASVKGITEVYQQFSLETFSKEKKKVNIWFLHEVHFEWQQILMHMYVPIAM